jgi:hypothetical protein
MSYGKRGYSKRGWKGIPYREKSQAEWDGLNRQEAENRQLKKLGHQALLIEQKRYVYGGPELDFKVWVSCTCMTWMPDVLPSTEAALAAHAEHVLSGKKKTA